MMDGYNCMNMTLKINMRMVKKCMGSMHCVWCSTFGTSASSWVVDLWQVGGTWFVEGMGSRFRLHE